MEHTAFLCTLHARRVLHEQSVTYLKQAKSVVRDRTCRMSTASKEKWECKVENDPESNPTRVLASPIAYIIHFTSTDLEWWLKFWSCRSLEPEHLTQAQRHWSQYTDSGMFVALRIARRRSVIPLHAVRHLHGSPTVLAGHNKVKY